MPRALQFSTLQQTVKLSKINLKDHQKKHPAISKVLCHVLLWYSTLVLIVKVDNSFFRNCWKDNRQVGSFFPHGNALKTNNPGKLFITELNNFDNIFLLNIIKSHIPIKNNKLALNIVTDARTVFLIRIYNSVCRRRAN